MCFKKTIKRIRLLIKNHFKYIPKTNNLDTIVYLKYKVVYILTT